VRGFFYLLLIVMISISFAWLSSYPGELVITVHGTRIVLSLLTAVTGVLIVFFCVFFIWRISRYVIFAPLLLKRYMQTYRKDHGYQLLSIGLFAVFAGDSATARHMARKSSKLLKGREVLLLLLESQTKLLDLDHKGAANFFERMRRNPQTRLLALKSLFQEAIKSGAAEAANQYAQEAMQINPCLKWANTAVTERLAAEGSWGQAISLFKKYAKAQPRNVVLKEKLVHQYVILMIGQAQNLSFSHPEKACKIAIKAHKLQPSFVPAVNTAARILFHLREIRKGLRLIEAIWKERPHPDLGLTYVNAGAQDEAPIERLKRAQQLARFNPSSHESQMLVARTALEVGKVTLANKSAIEASKTQPTKNTFLLLSDIESALTEDQGKIRCWLTKAVRADLDMAWISDGIILNEWSPYSPITGCIGTCEWKMPARYYQSVSYEKESIE